MNILIVDDEFHCRNVIQKMVEANCPEIKAIFEADTVQRAFDCLKKEQIDIIFLDIQLNDQTAFDLLNQLNEIEFQIIFTTAYDNYAVKAFEFAAVHYLLKPVAPSDIIEAISRCRKNELLYKKEVLNKTQGFYLRTHENSYDIIYDQITYIEADGSYSTIFNSKKQTVFTSKKLADYKEILNDDFYRIHNSIIVNMNYVQKIDKQGLMVILKDDTKLPLSRRKKTDFKKSFQLFLTRNS